MVEYQDGMYGDWDQQQSEKRIAKLTAQKVLEAQRQNAHTHLPRHYSAPTHKSVLLERWAKGTREIAEAIIDYDDMRGGYFHHQIGFGDAKRFTTNRELAVRCEIAYLNSAAEVGK